MRINSMIKTMAVFIAYFKNEKGDTSNIVALAIGVGLNWPPFQPDTRRSLEA
jgi:hypothetical protein